MKKFNIGDLIHAKSDVPWLKQHPLHIEYIVNSSLNYKNYGVHNIVTNQKYVLPVKEVDEWFEKTVCYARPNHPNTDIFK